MAGLGRVQQIFNRAVLGTLATLIGFARGGAAGLASSAAAGKGHPILAKLIKSSNPRANTPSTVYPGYCYGTGEAERRLNQRYARISKEHGL